MMAEPLRCQTAWLDRIEAFADSERVSEATTIAAWRRRYEDEITVRTKSEWMKHLKKSLSWTEWPTARSPEAGNRGQKPLRSG